MPPQSIKIENARYVITVDAERRILEGGSILIEDGRISRVGKTASLGGVRADRVIDGRHLVMTPGFLNGHMHISYAHAVRGIFPDNLGSPLAHVFKLQMAMTEEEEYATTLLGLVELLKNGTAVKTLVANQGGSADNLAETYTLTAAEIGTDVNTKWTLNVADTEAQDGQFGNT